MSDWPPGFRVTVALSGPGVHQIRLYANSHPSKGEPKSQNLIRVACVCGERLALIEPGEDCWTPFRAHERGHGGRPEHYTPPVPEHHAGQQLSEANEL